MWFSLVLGIANLAPIPLLDGGQITAVALQSIGCGEYLMMIPSALSTIVLVLFFIIVNFCIDWNLFEFDLEQENIS